MHVKTEKILFTLLKQYFWAVKGATIKDVPSGAKFWYQFIILVNLTFYLNCSSNSYSSQEVIGVWFKLNSVISVSKLVKSFLDVS